MRLIALVAKKKPLHSSKAIFDATVVKECCIQAQCNVLNKLGRVVKPKARPPISQNNRLKIVTWAKRYLKVDFSKVIFTNES